MSRALCWAPYAIALMCTAALSGKYHDPMFTEAQEGVTAPETGPPSIARQTAGTSDQHSPPPLAGLTLCLGVGLSWKPYKPHRCLLPGPQPGPARSCQGSRQGTRQGTCQGARVACLCPGQAAASAPSPGLCCQLSLAEPDPPEGGQREVGT